MDGFLLTENGKVFEGKLLGSHFPRTGELVFTTSMQGYTESVTDPSYAGQILIFSFPLIGNYGFYPEHMESSNVWVNGVIALELYENNNFLNFLKMNNVPVLTGIDTRALIREITHTGSLIGIIYPGKAENELKDAENILLNTKNPNDLPLFRETASKKKIFYKGNDELNIALIDLGVKNGILKNLIRISNVTLIPYYEKFNPDEYDGIVISNGPGNPSHNELDSLVNSINNFKKPVLGICLGHQLIARSFKLKTYKMKFGHRGINHPVIYNGNVYITTHNHGFAVKADENDEIIIDQIDLNDNTVEGFRHRYLPITGVQYHPESRPGTSDTRFIFENFKEMVIKFAKE